ncbi:MAG: hypothetical protein QM756_05225 [Polyangiaceae bacterium]
MKKSEPDFEEDLLRALRSQMDGPPQAAARVRVSQQLEATFAGLDLGVANLASLPHSVTTLKAGAVKASTATKVVAVKAVAAPVAAKAALASATPLLSMSTHPVLTWLATFAVGAAAGTGIMVAKTVVTTHDAAKPAISAKAAVSAPSSARLQRRVATPTPKAAEPPKELVAEPIVAEAAAPRPALAPVTQPRRAVAAPAPKPAPAVASPSAAPTTIPNTLGAQQSLLDQARDALTRGDGDGALAALSAHERAFSSTLLEEERASLKIEIARSERSRSRSTGFGRRFSDALPAQPAAAVDSRCALADSVTVPLSHANC